MTTDRCPDALTLSRLVDAELESADAHTVRAHAAECPTCRAGLESLTRASALGRPSVGCSV